MCCLITVLVFLGPRIGIILWYLFDTARWNEAFDSLILPCLGFFLLPWTTIVYVFVYTGGLSIFDWLLIAAAFILDVSSYGGGAFGNRDRIPGYKK